MINNDKNLWRNRGFLAHGMKENQKTYWRNELSLLLSEAPSVDSKYREIITKNGDSVLFCLNQECNNIVDFVETLFWSDLTFEQDKEGVQYIIDYNRGRVLCIYGIYTDLLMYLFETIKNYGGLMPVDYLSEESSREIIDNLKWERGY